MQCLGFAVACAASGSPPILFPVCDRRVWLHLDWLVAIGLSSHVHARDRSAVVFSAALIGFGTIVFALLFIALPFCGLYSTSGPAPLPWWVRATIPAVSLRLGLGFVHFLYDRWLWKLSDPMVRAMIGKDLF